MRNPLSISMLALSVLLLFATELKAQRANTKTFKVEFLEKPTVPENLVRNVAFQIQVPSHVFDLQGLRLFGKAIDEMKSNAERLSGMKYFTLGQEVEVVDEWATLVVDIALGEFVSSLPKITGTPVSKDSEEKMYTAMFECSWPMQVMIREKEGQLLDGFTIQTSRNISFGNEDYTKIESGRGRFSYEKGKWDFRNEAELRAELSSGDGVPRIMWKMFLNQFSEAIDELERRLFFIEGKREVTLGSAKGRKHDYTELDDAMDLAKELMEVGDYGGLDNPMEVWSQWLEQADFINPKSAVNQEVAVELMLSLATAHLYRKEWHACAQQIGKARTYISPLGATFARIQALNRLLELRRKSDLSNGDKAPTEEEKIYKAVDLKDLIAKRTQNKDVQMFIDADVYEAYVTEYQDWQSTVLADAPENQAQEAGELSMSARLGQRVTRVPGGFALGLMGLTDADLVGQPFPSEILDIENLVNLSLNGLKMGEIPSSIGDLGTLKVLDLTSNQLNELPARIGELALLERLVLRNNNLTQLPEELVHCAELKMIDLRGNPISAEELSKWNAAFNEGVKIKTD
ncbi:MAG: leucine-rich repeat domain-containing protein [Flavobacteriales bacterium]